VFRGNHQAKVEESGRIKLPVAVKDAVDRMQVAEFYVTSPNGTSAEVWPLAEWEKVEKRLAANSSRTDVQDYMEQTSFYGLEVKMDSAGRFVLPQILREKAKLSGDVAILGKARYLEIYNLETLAESIKASAMSKQARAGMSAILDEQD
jgi:MraZ protein